MAITFRGTTITGPITADASGDIVFSIECSPYSKVKVDVTGIMAQMYSLVATTAAGQIQPVFKARKVTGAPTGGMILTKNTFDTTQTSDAGVIVRQALGRAGGNNMALSTTGTPLTMGQTFSTRNTTIVGQEMFIADLCIIKKLPSSNIYLSPGEALIVTWTDGTAPVGGEAFFAVLWEEDSLGTEYTVSGTVTLSAVASAGAKVVLVTDTNRDLPAARVEVLTTDVSGNWTKTLASGIVASAFVQTRDGETLYTAEGKPYLKKP